MTPHISYGQIFAANGKSLVVHFVEAGTVFFNYVRDGWTMIGGYRMPLTDFVAEMERAGAREVVSR